MYIVVIYVVEKIEMFGFLLVLVIIVVVVNFFFFLELLNC